MQYPVTHGILLLCCVMYALSLWYGLDDFDLLLLWRIPEESLVTLGAMKRPAVYQGEVWRLLSAGFLHANVLHLVLNGWALLLLGRMCEDLIGGPFTGLIFCASVIMGALLSCSVGTDLSVGASGGVLGCLFAITAIGLRDYGRFTDDARKMFRILTILGVLNLILGFFLPMIDNAAHLGGTAMGFALGLCGPEVKFSNFGEKE